MNSKRVVELIRVSTQEQAADDRASIPAQRDANQRTAATYGLTIVESIEIVDVSGVAVIHSPGMQRLLRLIESPDIAGVVAKEFTRVTRPENLDLQILQRFLATKSVLYLPDGMLDFSRKTDRLMAMIHSAIAGFEVSVMAERVWSAKESKRRDGGFAQNSVCLPYGVGYERNRGWFYTEQAQLVSAAFLQFLSGRCNYRQIANMLGVSPRGAHLILRNSIYTGWRTITQRRDPSPAARHSKIDGRQGDRPKIARSPEDVIRVKVLSDPLISEADFARVQEMMDLKQNRHWRTSENYEHRFAYNGFLLCGCGQIVYTAHQRHDYYVCKNRRLNRSCDSSYMRRDRLDAALDLVFSTKLTDRTFLRKITLDWEGSTQKSPSSERVRVDLAKLRQKRERVLETYVEGWLGKDERDTRLARIDKEINSLSSLVLGTNSSQQPTASQLASIFSVFSEWGMLQRGDKRRLLAALTPEIHVKDYQVMGISLLTSAFSHEYSRTGRDSSPPPA